MQAWLALDLTLCVSEGLRLCSPWALSLEVQVPTGVGSAGLTPGLSWGPTPLASSPVAVHFAVILLHHGSACIPLASSS